MKTSTIHCKKNREQKTWLGILNFYVIIWETNGRISIIVCYFSPVCICVLFDPTSTVSGINEQIFSLTCHFLLDEKSSAVYWYFMFYIDVLWMLGPKIDIYICYVHHVEITVLCWSGIISAANKIFLVENLTRTRFIKRNIDSVARLLSSAVFVVQTWSLDFFQRDI